MKRLALLLLCLPFTVAAAQNAPASLEQSLDTMIASRFKPDLPGVAALVVKDGKPLLRKGYGMANLELGVPIKPEHVFRIGSTTKMFTATAIMLLVEEGKIALDAPVSRYLPDSSPQWEKVTIEHLLTHTSGIANLSMDSGYMRTTGRLEHTVDEVVAAARERPLDFAPGTRFVYNNTGYHLLGQIIEKVSGQDYYAFVDQRIARPLGLKHTGAGDDQHLHPGLVTGYQSGPRPAMLLSNSNFYAAGGMISTVDDLATFMQALQAGKIVSPASVRRMNTPYVLADGKASEYGLGEWLRLVEGHHLVGHGGYVVNFYSELEMDIDAGIVTVTLHNGDRFGGDNEVLSKNLILTVRGLPTAAPRQ